ncbi:LOW QUALITY PROTEIN: uncharacterized protein LOC119511752 [Choloepus didactylus]|uniref:LOW QUALITY PROTEIN: uncharacterized protein LOC119511752 n=1 Tax=Choloepus didactylus TaxID=27675 RepID=UPI00189FA5D1|nr:LOW QUALITY PROTEIN: uncharacterized protein LOC119511752 [Choloepus didactylus]
MLWQCPTKHIDQMESLPAQCKIFNTSSLNAEMHEILGPVSYIEDSTAKVAAPEIPVEMPTMEGMGIIPESACYTDGSASRLSPTWTAVEVQPSTDIMRNCLSHILNTKTTQRRIIREALNTHGLARNHINDGSITRFQKFGAIFQLLTRMMINLLLQLSKLASNVSCVTIQHRCIASTDLAWMVQDNHLSSETSCFHWWIIFAVTSHIAMMNIFYRHVLDIEAHIVPRKSFTQSFMVHLNRLNFSCNVDWSKGDHHAWFENISLHSAYRDSTNTTNFVDILKRQMQGFVSWTSGWQDAIQSFKQHGSTGIAILTGDFPSLEPRHVSTWLQHVVTIPTRNWHKCYCAGVVANLLNVGADFLNDFLVSLLAVRWLSGIHFVNTNN